MSPRRAAHDRIGRRLMTDSVMLVNGSVAPIFDAGRRLEGARDQHDDDDQQRAERGADGD